MPEGHLRESEFTYRVCGPYTKNNERIQKFKETRACFQHDRTCGDFKNLTKTKASDKTLGDEAFNVAKNTKHYEYQRGIASEVDKFFDKKTASAAIKNEFISYKELAEELHKPIIGKFEKRKVHSPFIGNVWGVDLTDMQSRSKFNEGYFFLLCVIVIFITYTQVIPLKDKETIRFTNAFQKTLDESNRKPNNI